MWRRIHCGIVATKTSSAWVYDTQTSTYVTLSDVKGLVLAHDDFKVLDAKTEEDLTRAILLQIILEEEAGGVPLFTTPMLSQMIRFYGHSMQGMVGGMLEKNIQSFIDMQSQFAEQSKQGGATPESWAQFAGDPPAHIRSADRIIIGNDAGVFDDVRQGGGLAGLNAAVVGRGQREIVI